MDKDEILMKSRMENKGCDMPMIEDHKNSARFAVIFGLCFIAVIGVLCLIVHSKMIYGVAATEMCMVFAMSLHNAIKKKERKYIIMAATNVIPFLLLTGITVCEIFNIHP